MRSSISIISALFLGATSLSAAVPVPAATPAPQAQAAAPSHGDIAVRRMVLATGVVSHESQGAKENFSVHDGKVFAFADISSHGHDHVTFHWKHEGKTYNEFKAGIKDSKRWRTFSSVRALAGSWSVALQDAQGNVLKEISFNVAHDAPAGTPAVAQPAVKEASGIKEVLSSLEPAKPAH